MKISESYNAWTKTYDLMLNKTRDIEAKALRTVLHPYSFNRVLELGCGTGKNTGYLASKSDETIAVDFSEEMMNTAKEKSLNENIIFKLAEIGSAWDFESNYFDLISTSLVLEHIEDLNFIFSEANRVLISKGLFYIGELHPFKQYLGSKAKFELEGSVHFLECYNHNISDFFASATAHGFIMKDMNEWFDEEEKNVPRVLTMVFQKL